LNLHFVKLYFAGSWCLFKNHYHIQFCEIISVSLVQITPLMQNGRQFQFVENTPKVYKEKSGSIIVLYLKSEKSGKQMRPGEVQKLKTTEHAVHECSKFYPF
jgi:hypothetical protein